MRKPFSATGCPLSVVKREFLVRQTICQNWPEGVCFKPMNVIVGAFVLVEGLSRGDTMSGVGAGSGPGVLVGAAVATGVAVAVAIARPSAPTCAARALNSPARPAMPTTAAARGKRMKR